MPVNVTATLRTTHRRLETERARVDRQMGALRAALDSSGARLRLSRRRRPMSAAARRALSRRMKAYWYWAKRKAAKKGS